MQLPFKFYPQQPIAGDKLIVTYNNGILLDSLDKEIYLKFGFGDEFVESKVYETKMIKKNGEYLAVVPLLKSGFLFIAFKDNFGNSDDNNETFYRIGIKSKE
ncbi:hypothetical protein Calow_1339 [Caldicellulosiruptor owensensis OL]|uniref:Uncharacterized protein n=1 Tax=Caldicellulosiruptor owensensis (strain ATCC 700167 / DSM 13100 / OL) TaxID=632518 RepID=E4Q2F4_CALOW|nr:hypothetical protein [Caldicellulosiruptor owensensis]ADQ04896.1 hypothetical protein Calow_1339 [Caldicellulosiruptor owensensis OL]